eukprot:COSAG02_NODE_10477_length_1933_cov_1.840785_4_plen_148_part_00
MYACIAAYAPYHPSSMRNPDFLVPSGQIKWIHLSNFGAPRCVLPKSRAITVSTTPVPPYSYMYKPASAPRDGRCRRATASPFDPYTSTYILYGRISGCARGARGSAGGRRRGRGRAVVARGSPPRAGGSEGTPGAGHCRWRRSLILW